MAPTVAGKVQGKSVNSESYGLVCDESSTAPQGPIVIDLNDSASFKNIPAQVITIKDPLYKKTKTYEGVPLLKILERIPGLCRLKAAETLVVFEAKDGYKAPLSLSKALQQQGYVAVRDREASGVEKWLNFKWNGKIVNPAPYYLVWKGLPESDRVSPWPYQLVKIRIVATKDYYAGIYPKQTDRSIQNGFSLYSGDCLHCHPIGKTGGTQAIDFTKSLQRWQDTAAFIKAFRTNMPGKPSRGDITNGQATDIFHYLQAIAPSRNQKK